jgi:hypothetical protein
VVGWDRRWCTYSNGMLSYYLKERDAKAQGSISLTEMKGVRWKDTSESRDPTKPSNRFELETYERSYVFR